MERREGVEDGEIPIEPAQQTYNNIEVESGDRKRRRLKRAVLWRQLPVGQIIAFVMVDITKPPAGKLSLFDLYVVLSRSSGQKSIQILSMRVGATRRDPVKIRLALSFARYRRRAPTQSLSSRTR